MTSSSGFFTGSLRSRIWSINVKMAVFAPIPSDSDRMATVANRGLRRSPRKAYRRSAKISVIGRLDGIGGRRVCWNPVCRHGCAGALDAPAAPRTFTGDAGGLLLERVRLALLGDSFLHPLVELL